MVFCLRAQKPEVGIVTSLLSYGGHKQLRARRLIVPAATLEFAEWMNEWINELDNQSSCAAPLSLSKNAKTKMTTNKKDWYRYSIG